MVAIVAGLLPDSIVAGECKGIWGFWEGGIENKGDSGRGLVSMGFGGGRIHHGESMEERQDQTPRTLGKRRENLLHRRGAETPRKTMHWKVPRLRGRAAAGDDARR